MELIKKENHFQILSKSVKEVEVSTWKWFEIEWYASTKDKDRYWDIVEPTAFKKAMKQYSQNPIILLQHNPDKPIWKVNEFSIDNNGLYIKALITEDTDGVFSKIQNNILKWFSIWFCLKDFELEEQEDWNYVNVIKDLDLLEISLVSIPANPYCLTKSLSDCFKSKDINMDEKEIITEEVIEETTNEVEEVEAIAEETDKHDSEDFENEIKEADENSEISQSEEETAENVDEKPTTEVVETDETETKSFEAMRKEFNWVLEKKDIELKSFQKKFDTMEKEFNQTKNLLVSIVDALKSMRETMEKTVITPSIKYTNSSTVKDKSADAIEEAVKLMKSL